MSYQTPENSTDVMALPPLDEAEQPRVFYGWYMVPVATLGMMCTAPAQTFGVSVFKPYFAESLGLTNAQISTAYMFGTVLAALPLTYIGWLMDHLGPRRMIAAVVVMLACGCAMASQAAGFFTLFFAFLLLRMFGQGSLGMLSGNTLAMWFNRRLGFVHGIMVTGMAGAIALTPSVNYWLIQTLGWRHAYLALGGMVLAVMLPLLALVYRNRPEDVGQLPDGDRPEDLEDDSGEPRPADQRAWTLRQAMGSRAYWIVAVCIGLFSLTLTAVAFCAPSIFESRGMSTDGAARATAVLFLWMGGTLAAAQILAGLIADRVRLNLMLAVGTALLAVAVGLLRLPMSHHYAGWLGAVIGIAQATIAAVGGTIWVRYYGRAHLGKIRGSLTTMLVASSGLGPAIVDGLAGVSGNYRSVLMLLTLAPLPLAVAALFATRPPDRQPATACTSDPSP